MLPTQFNGTRNMSEIKKVFNLIALMIILSLGVFSVAQAQEDDVDFSKYGSEEEAMRDIQSEAGGEDEAVVEIENDGTLGEYQEEEPPIPTLENAIEQIDDEMIVGNGNNNVVPGENAAIQKEKKVNQFSTMAIIFVGIPVVVLLLFVFRKYFGANKK